MVTERWGAGVRARQEKVVFVTCDDEDVLESTLRPLIGVMTDQFKSANVQNKRPQSPQALRLS